MLLSSFLPMSFLAPFLPFFLSSPLAQQEISAVCGTPRTRRIPCCGHQWSPARRHDNTWITIQVFHDAALVQETTSVYGRQLKRPYCENFTNLYLSRDLSKILARRSWWSVTFFPSFVFLFAPYCFSFSSPLDPNGTHFGRALEFP